MNVAVKSVILCIVQTGTLNNHLSQYNKNLCVVLRGLNIKRNRNEVKYMLQLENIKWSPAEGPQVLNGINLNIPDNKLIVITGPNGSGKTTTAKIIAGLEKPSEGRILLDGEDITDKDVTQRAVMGISFAFQQPVRFKGLSVRDLLTLAFSHKPDDVELCGVLQKVGLCAPDYLDRELNSNLSGGEMKRIEIATVLARHTKVTVFDEPEAGIDLWSFSNLIDVFKNIKKELNGTLVIISHQERILSIADEIVVVDNGVISSQGGTDEIMPSLLSGRPGCGHCENSANCTK